MRERSGQMDGSRMTYNPESDLSERSVGIESYFRRINGEDSRREGDLLTGCGKKTIVARENFDVLHVICGTGVKYLSQDAQKGCQQGRSTRPRSLASLPGMASVLVPLRPSSEHILIVRAPGAGDWHGCHSIPPFFSILLGSYSFVPTNSTRRPPTPSWQWGADGRSRLDRSSADRSRSEDSRIIFSTFSVTAAPR